MTNDLLPDEIYLEPKCCADPFEGQSWSGEDMWSQDCEHDNKPTKYIRSDLVSTPNKPAEVDLDGSKRVVRGEKEKRYDMDYTYDLGWNAAIRAVQASGHLATGRGGDDRLKKQVEYSSYLQQIIESLCDGRTIPEPKTNAVHHYEMAVSARTEQQKTAELGDRVELICSILLEYDQAEGLRSEQWVWPEHKDDDGYRGDGGYVHIAPTDIQIRYRERANAIIKRAHLTAISTQRMWDKGLSKCPKCGGAADNGHDREIPPNPYHCTKCDEPAVDAGELEAALEYFDRFVYEVPHRSEPFYVRQEEGHHLRAVIAAARAHLEKLKGGV